MAPGETAEFNHWADCCAGGGLAAESENGSAGTRVNEPHAVTLNSSRNEMICRIATAVSLETRPRFASGKFPGNSVRSGLFIEPRQPTPLFFFVFPRPFLLPTFRARQSALLHRLPQECRASWKGRGKTKKKSIGAGAILYTGHPAGVCCKLLIASPNRKDFRHGRNNEHDRTTKRKDATLWVAPFPRRHYGKKRDAKQVRNT
jgi:hypothetical protein